MNILQHITNFFKPQDRTSALQAELIRTRELTNRIMMSHHYSAAEKSRLTNNWASTITSLSVNIKAELRTIIARSISSYDNNLNATSLIDTLVNNVVGAGFKIYSNITDEQGEPITALNKYLDNAWEQYMDEWSSEGDVSYADAQEIRFREMLVSGSTITKLTQSWDKNSLLPIKNQLISSLRLDETKDTQPHTLDMSKPQKYTFFGINLDNYSRARSYYLTGIDQAISADYMKLHYFKKFSEQYIGLPKLTNSSKYLWAMDQILSDKLVSSQIAAKIALFMPDDMAASNLSTDSSTGNTIWESGEVFVGKPGQKPEVIQSDATINQITDHLMKHMQHLIAAGSGVSYQSMSRDLAGTNLASARVNVNADRRTFKAYQRRFVDTVLKWDRYQFMKYMAMSGKLQKFGIRYGRFLQESWNLCKAKYQPQGFDMLDPYKETMSNIELMNNGYKSEQRFHSENGHIYEEEITQIKKEQKNKAVKPEDKSTTKPAKDDDGEDE